MTSQAEEARKVANGSCRWRIDQAIPEEDHFKIIGAVQPRLDTGNWEATLYVGNFEGDPGVHGVPLEYKKERYIGIDIEDVIGPTVRWRLELRKL